MTKKSVQAVNFIAHDTTKTAVDAALATETVGIKSVDIASREIVNKARQKAVNEDADNDMLHAVDSVKRRVAEPAVQNISKPQRLQKEQKRRDSLKDKKSKNAEKLQNAPFPLK